jgi:hypothetical protein
MGLPHDTPAAHREFMIGRSKKESREEPKDVVVSASHVRKQLFASGSLTLC